MLRRFGDLSIDSDIPFDALPPADQPADIVIRAGVLRDDPRTILQTWPDASHGTWLTIARRDGGYRLEFPELQCDVSTDGRLVTYQHLAAVQDGRVAHLLLHQVVPLAVSRSGRLVFHACAVATPAGAVAFVGESGAGKSTVAAALSRRGCLVVADDALLVDLGDGAPLVRPTADGVRLWADMHWLAPDADRTDDPWDKLRVAVPLARHPQRLTHVIEVGYDSGEQPRLDRLGASDLRIVLLSHLFRMDVTDHAETRRLFHQVHDVAEQVVAWRFAYRDGAEYIDAACDTVLRRLEARPT